MSCSRLSHCPVSTGGTTHSRPNHVPTTRKLGTTLPWRGKVVPGLAKCDLWMECDWGSDGPCHCSPSLYIVLTVLNPFAILPESRSVPSPAPLSNPPVGAHVALVTGLFAWHWACSGASVLPPFHDWALCEWGRRHSKPVTLFLRGGFSGLIRDRGTG